MRLIDLDELLKFPIRLDHYDKENGDEHFAYGVEAVIEYAENLPVVEAEPVRHGKGCKFCKGRSYTKKPLTVITRTLKRVEVCFNFCPNCGRDMRVTNTNGDKGGSEQ